MAKHSEQRFSTGRAIATNFLTLAGALEGKRLSAPEKRAFKEIARAASFISSGDITELGRREMYASGRVACVLLDKQPGRYVPALAKFGDSFIQFASKADYNAALDLSRQAAELVA